MSGDRGAAPLPPALQEYLAEWRLAAAEFGPDTVVLYHNGKFYDVYGDGERGCDVQRVSDVCGTLAFRRRSGDAFMQCGLHADTLEHKALQLTAAGMTVVRMDAVDGLPGSDGLARGRRRARVYSPGAPPACPEQDAGAPARLCVLVPGRREWGGAVVEALSGACWVFQTPGTEEALRRAFLRDRPAEALVVLREGVGASAAEEAAGLVRACGFVAVSEARVPAETLAPGHVGETLRRALPGVPAAAALNRPDAAIEADGLPMAAAAMAHALHALHRRDPQAIQSLQPRPRVLREEDGMRVCGDALRQLGADEAWLLPRCKTPAGRRLLASRIAVPSRSADEIEERLQAVASAREAPALDAARAAMARFGDLERVLARMAAGRSPASDWGRVAASARSALDAASALSGSGLAASERAADLAWAVRAAVEEAVGPCPEGAEGDPEAAPGRHAGLDGARADVARVAGALASVAAALSEAAGAVPGTRDSSRVFRLEAAGGVHAVWGTEARLKRLARELGRRWVLLGPDSRVLAPGEEPPPDRGGLALFRACDLRPGRRSGARVALQCPELDRLSSDLDEAHARLNAEREAAHRAECARFQASGAADAARALCDAVAELDVACSCAEHAARRGHARPSVLRDGRSAGVAARGLRHPAFDVIDTPDGYTANDVDLMGDRRGILVYGANGSGKSCLMKSVGLAVLMAQAGMYVAADSLELHPFSALCTRFPCGDDLGAGRSTFVSEMVEVRYMVENAAEGWLIIGDELCSGTNEVGGTAVVAAGVHALHSGGARFLFATHMLMVADMLGGLQGVRVCHMSVRRAAGGGVVYGRLLQDGRGEVDYTVDVVTGLGFPARFLELANAFSRRARGLGAVEGFLTGVKKSRYNSRVYLDLCRLCGQPAEHTHHIVPQAEFAADPASGARRARGAANRRHNLLALCMPCHARVHGAAEHKEGAGLATI